MRAAVVSPAKRTPETDAVYACARLRGMRSHLLDAAFYERLIETPDVQSAIKVLMDSGYAADLENELVRGRTSAVVDEALKDNMVDAYRKVLSFLDPGARELLSTLLGRWDVFNIKAILRGAHNHVSFDEVNESILPAGYLATTELEALAKIDDVKAIIDTMGMWRLVFAGPLRQAYPEYARTNQLAVLELALDREYARWAAERLVGERASVEVARRVLGTQVDTQNLVTVFRMIKEHIPPGDAARYFLQGGRHIREDVFGRLAGMSDIDDVLDALKATPYGEALDAVAVRYLEAQSIAVFERALEELLMRRALGSGIRDPESVGVAISYLWGKQNEVTNVRIIIHGKDVGMPAQRVREELILV